MTRAHGRRGQGILTVVLGKEKVKQKVTARWRRAKGRQSGMGQVSASSSLGYV